MIKRTIKKLISQAGFSLVRTQQLNEEINRKFLPDEAQQYNWLKELNIKTVLDIGAHIGQSSLFFHKLLPEAKIIAFEPIADCFKQLKENTTNIVDVEYYNCAVGSKMGDTSFYVNEFSGSSSVLSVSEKHTEAFPFTAKEQVINVKIETLDNLFVNKKLDSNILVKIDVQGFEKDVFLGGNLFFESVYIVIVETSFKELYKGQELFDSIYNYLTEKGFKYAGSWEQIKHPENGSILQQDAIFIKR